MNSFMTFEMDFAITWKILARLDPIAELMDKRIHTALLWAPTSVCENGLPNVGSTLYSLSR